MEKEKPDNIVYSRESGYNANILPYGTSVGAPVIKINDVASWKNRGISNVNKEFENKFNELKIQYQISLHCPFNIKIESTIFDD